VKGARLGVDATGTRAIELGDQRAARVGRNGRYRAGTRPETKTIKCKRCFCFGLKSHASIARQTRHTLLHHSKR